MWTTNEAVAVYIAVAVVIAALVGALILRKTVRTRLATERQIRDDPDINEWLVVFDWTNKILYVPTIVMSLVAALLMLLGKVSWLDWITPGLVGGLWFTVFFINFLIEEYELNIKVILIGLLCAALILLWLHLVGWVRPFLSVFHHISVRLNAGGYLVLAVLVIVVIAFSSIRVLFFYVAITPNFVNIQEGPTETGTHVAQEDYNSRIDTRDFLERLMGFGRILIIFKDQKRAPLSLLVWRIKQRATSLEAIRGTISVEQRIRYDATQPAPTQESRDE